MQKNSIIVKNLSKKFKLKSGGLSSLLNNKSKKLEVLLALDDISFSVKKGEILGVIGLNGSGKTTLLRTIAGIYQPDSGSIRVNGKLSPLLQLGAGFQGDLNAKENIIMNGMLLGISKEDIEKKVVSILQYAELTKFQNLKIKYFSSGMKARLSFSTAMQIDPDILLVDEIQSVGDKNFRKKSYESFISFKRNKKTILHATHNLEKLADFSDKVLLLDQGKNIMMGEPKEVIKKYLDLKPS